MKVKGFLTCLFFLLLAVSFFPQQSSCAQWLDEFEDICSKVAMGDELSVEELMSLLERADKLKAVIEASDEPSKKVYLMRLQKCKAFFEYTVELKTGKKPGEAAAGK